MMVGKYLCTVEGRGWSYAVVVLRVRAKFLGLIPYWRKVWEGDKHSKDSINAGNLRPRELRDWCERVVADYEDYRDAWAREGK